MLELKGISKYYNVGSVNEMCLFRDFNLNIEKGEFLSVVGSNGSGKTSMLNIICGSIPVESGQILIGDTDITKEKEYTVDEKIPEIEERIASDDFVRCHTSFLVNFSCVKECTRKKLLLENGKTVDVSRSYWKKTEDAYVEWVKRWAR